MNIFFLFLLAALACMPAMAHETWLAATRHTLPGNGRLTFDMSSGEAFPALGTSIEADRIELADCRQGDATFPLKPGRKGAKALSLSAQAPAKGSVSCRVRLAPRKLDLAITKVQEYLDDIDAPAAVRDAWAAAPEPKRWVEVYTKNAAAMVPDKANREDGPGKPMGLNLEFVPDSDLAGGRLTGPLGVTLLLDGKPLAGVSIALFGAGKTAPDRQRTDTQGHASFPALQAGRWMLSATDLRVVDAGKGTWESQFATLVFEILPAEALKRPASTLKTAFWLKKLALGLF